MSKQSKHKLNQLRKGRVQAVALSLEQEMTDWNAVMRASQKHDDGHYSVEPEANEAMDRLTEQGMLSRDPDGKYRVTQKGIERLQQMKVVRDKSSELSRVILEQPELAGALTPKEKTELFASGHTEAMTEEFALDFKAKLAQAEKQGHFCSLCGIQFEGIGHSAAPFPGRCCKECSDTRVLPMRADIMQQGGDPRAVTLDPVQASFRDGLTDPASLQHLERQQPKATAAAAGHWADRRGLSLEKGPNWADRDKLLPPPPPQSISVPQQVGAGKGPAFTNKIRRDP